MYPLSSRPASRPTYPENMCTVNLQTQTGVAFKGIANYKRVFATLRFFRQVLMQDATTTFRLSYDWSKQQVRVTWNMVLMFKASKRPIHVDGISAYHVNGDGNAYKHELETVIVNGVPVEPPFAYAWINLPAWVSGSSHQRQPVAMPTPLANSVVSSPKLFASAFAAAAAAAAAEESTELADLKSANKIYDSLVSDVIGTFETDPEVRKDFLKALTVLEAVSSGPSEVSAVTSGSSSSSSSGHDSGIVDEDDTPKPAEEVRSIKDKKQGGGWFGVQGPTECDTSWDCTGGMVCCDFLLVKVCCSNGVKQPKFGDWIPSLVPVPGKGRNENDQTPSRPPPRNGGSSNSGIGSW